jgi:hypothetical protein
MIVAFGCTKKVEENIYKVTPMNAVMKMGEESVPVIATHETYEFVINNANRASLEGYDGREKYVPVKRLNTGKYPPFFFMGSLSLNKTLENLDYYQIALNKARVTKYHLAYKSAGTMSAYPVIDVNANTVNTPCDLYVLTVTYNDGTTEVYDPVLCKRGTVTGLYAPSANALINVENGAKKIKITREDSVLQPYYNLARLKMQNRYRYKIEVDGVKVANDFLNGTKSPPYWMDHRW